MKVVDLSYEIEEGMTVFHTYWHPEVEIERLGTIEDEGRETRKVSFGTHTGTHVDAPLHFIEGGNSIDEISLEVLMGPIQFVDCTHLGENDAITVALLKDVSTACRMIFRFGWEDRWGDADEFYYDYPYFTVDAARYLVKEGVQLIGFDTPSPDASSHTLDGSEEDSPVHKVLLRNEVVIVEYLRNLAAIDDGSQWNISALPLKVRGADGMPARVVAWKR